MENFKISIYQAELILGYEYVQKQKEEDGISKKRKKVSPKITARWFKNSKMNLYYHTGGPFHCLFSSSLGFCCEYKEVSVYDAMYFFGFLALEECHEKGVTSIPQEQWQAYENYLKNSQIRHQLYGVLSRKYVESCMKRYRIGEWEGEEIPQEVIALCLEESKLTFLVVTPNREPDMIVTFLTTGGPMWERHEQKKEISASDVFKLFGLETLYECVEKTCSSLSDEMRQAYENYLKEKEKIEK